MFKLKGISSVVVAGLCSATLCLPTAAHAEAVQPASTSVAAVRLTSPQAVTTARAAICGKRHVNGKISHAIRSEYRKYRLHITTKFITRRCRLSDGTVFKTVRLVTSSRWTDAQTGKTVEATNCGGGLLDSYDEIDFVVNPDYTSRNTSITLPCAEDGTARKVTRLQNAPNRKLVFKISEEVVIGFAHNPTQTVTVEVPK